MGAVLAPLLFPTLVAGTTAYSAAVLGVNLALYAGTAAASMLLQPDMPKASRATGTKLSAAFGGAVTQSFHVGRKESAGSLVYIGSWGREGRTPNGFLVRVYALSDRPVAGFASYILAESRRANYDPDQTTIIDGVGIGHPIPAYDEGGDHRLWVKFHDGTQTVADGYLVAKFGTAEKRPWTSDHIGRGRAYMIVTQKYDPKKPIGEVDVTAVINNSYLYDFRSGGQVYGDQSTYAADPGNPVVVIYNIMRGIYHGNQWMFGGQKWPATRFDESSWVAAANKCDEDVDIAGGGTQKRYRIGAEIDVSEDPWTVIERCLKACNGRIVDSGGVFKIRVGGIGASDYSFSDDDIVVSMELSGRLYPERENIANTVTGTYVEPDNGGEVKPFKARYRQAYIDDDGDIRKTSIDFEYVRDNRQAQRCAMLALNDNRRFRTFVVPFWTTARKLEPGDVVSWTSARYGFDSKKFIVGDVTLRSDGVVVANLREADATDADWDLDQEDPYETGNFDEVTPAAQGVDLTIQAASITDDDNSTKRRPAILITADLDDDFVDCKKLWVKVRKKNGDQDVIYENMFRRFFDKEDNNYGHVKFTDNSFLQGREVQVACRIVPWTKRKTSWSNWTNVTLYNTANPETSDDPPPALAYTPTLTLQTRTTRSGHVRQRLKVNLNLTGRDSKESYIVRVIDETEDPAEQERYETREFPFWFGVRDGHSYDVKVIPVSRYGVKGSPSASATGVSMPVPKSGGNVPVVVGAEANGGHRRVTLEWDDVDRDAYPDYDLTQVQMSTSTSFAAPTRQNTRTTRGNQMVFANLGNGVTRYFRIRHKDSSGNPDGNGAGWSATLSATTGKLQNGDIDDGAVRRGHILDGEIVAGKLGDNAVKRGNIEDGEIVAGKLGPNAVKRGNIEDGEIVENKLDDGCVGTKKVKKRAIEGRAGKTIGTVTKTLGGSKQKTFTGDLIPVGKGIVIDNPNPSAVFLRIKYSASLDPNNLVDPTYSGSYSCSAQLTINIYSAAPDKLNKKEIVHSLTLSARAKSDGQTIIVYPATKTVDETIMYTYSSKTKKRKFWAQYILKVDPIHFNTTTWKSVIDNMSVQLSFAKR